MHMCKLKYAHEYIYTYPQTLQNMQIACHQSKDTVTMTVTVTVTVTMSVTVTMTVTVHLQM